MFCTNCGQTNRNDAQFCTKCGNNLHPGFTPPSVTESPTMPLPPPSITDDSPYQPPIGSSYPSQNIPQYTPPSFADYAPPLPGSASGRAIASLVLAIVSIFTCCFPLSIPAAILGKLEMNAIKAGTAPPAGMGLATAGFWIGLIGSIISFGFFILKIFFGLFAGLLSIFGVN